MYVFSSVESCRSYRSLGQHVKDLCQARYSLGSTVIRTMARAAKVPGSNPVLSTFHSLGENVFNFVIKCNDYTISGGNFICKCITRINNLYTENTC